MVHNEYLAYFNGRSSCVASTIINAVLAIVTPVLWLMPYVGDGDAKRLTVHGLRSLKYFTVLSNLLSATASLLYVLVSAAGHDALPVWVLVLKLVATSAVTLTLMTVLVLLGPQFGWKSMFEGTSLWMHLLSPLLAIVDCVLFVPVGTLPFGATFAAAAPCVLYGIWYLMQILRHDVQEGDKTYDFYGFLRWGRSRIPLVMCGMFAGSWVLGLALWLGSRALCLVA